MSLTRKRGRRVEIVTVGLNPNLQLVGSAPEGGAYDLGLWIGTNALATAPNLRQLFLLARKSFGAHERARLVGFRQYLTIIAYEAVGVGPGASLFPVERPVVTPTWKFVDGNVLWGIRRIPPNNHYLTNALQADGLAFRTGSTPSQLFETIVPTVNGPLITPPRGGRFPGVVLVPELGRFFDLRCTKWSHPSETDLDIRGPCDIAFYASVQQTNPATRPNPTAMPTLLTTEGVTPEDSFLQNFQGVNTPPKYGRIAGSLIFEIEDWAPSGMPKTYRSAATGDRVTRDTTQTGDNEMRQSGYETSCGESAVTRYGGWISPPGGPPGAPPGGTPGGPSGGTPPGTAPPGGGTPPGTKGGTPGLPPSGGTPPRGGTPGLPPGATQ